MTAPQTRAVTTGELLRSRPATKMPGYVALEVVRPCQKTELWHVVLPDAVDALVFEWAWARQLDCCPMCKSTSGSTTETDDGLERCVNCGCH